MKNGRLIALCGIDGSGKSTLANLLASQLTVAGEPAAVIRPLTGDAEFIAAVRALRTDINPTEDGPFATVTEHFLSAYFSFVFATNVRKLCLPLVSQGITVICDRYLYSHIVNQTVFGNDLRPFDVLFRSIPDPDMTFYVDVNVDTALRRIQERGQRGAFDHEWFLTSARDKFRELASTYHFITLDGEQSPNVVADTALRYLCKTDRPNLP